MSALAYPPGIRNAWQALAQERQERDQLQEKLSAITALLQNPSLEHKDVRIRAATVLALEAQRPINDPTAPFIVNLGDLAKRAGLIPPTPPGDEDASKRAYKSGRKLAGEAVAAVSDAFSRYQHPKEYDEDGKILSSTVTIQIDGDYTDVFRAGNTTGQRKLRNSRGISALVICANCGPDAPVIEHKTRQCVCGECGEPLTEIEKKDKKKPRRKPKDKKCSEIQTLETGKEEPKEISEFQALEHGDKPEETDFQTLETRKPKREHEKEGPTDFQTLEHGESPLPLLCSLNDDVEEASDWSRENHWLSPIPENIPQEMKADPCWVYSIPEWKGTRWTKPPYSVHTRKLTDKTDAKNWGMFKQALACVAGNERPTIGYVAGDGVVCFDLDNCRDSQTGEIQPWALAIIRRFHSYWEASPSGTGIRCWLRASIPSDAATHWQLDGHKIEVYSDGNYGTVTGHQIDGTPSQLNECSSEVAALWEECRPPVNTPRSTRSAVSDDDQALLERAKRAPNGPSFARLMGGDWTGHPSHSEGTWDLLGRFAYWTGNDADRMDRLYRASGMFNDKWDRADGTYGTFGQGEIQRALGKQRNLSSVFSDRSIAAQPTAIDVPHTTVEPDRPLTGMNYYGGD